MHLDEQLLPSDCVLRSLTLLRASWPRVLIQLSKADLHSLEDLFPLVFVT